VYLKKIKLWQRKEQEIQIRYHSERRNLTFVELNLSIRVILNLRDTEDRGANPSGLPFAELSPI
jgi:hypothetical protein